MLRKERKVEVGLMKLGLVKQLLLLSSFELYVKGSRLTRKESPFLHCTFVSSLNRKSLVEEFFLSFPSLYFFSLKS
jgi:hypothetical protein